MGVEAWSTTAASNNSSPPAGAPEGMAPSAVNDVVRQIMADVRSQLQDGQWLNWGHTPTRVDDDTFTVATDLTTTYHAGRRLKVTGSATGYCTIASSSYSSPNTTVNVTMDSGNLPATLSAVYVGIMSASDTSLPGSAVLARLLTVDGASSGLDADLLDGQQGSYYTSASNLGSGTLPDARLSSNVPLTNAANTFTAVQTIQSGGALIDFKTTVARGGGSNYIQFSDPSGAAGFVGFGSSNNNFYISNGLSGSLSFITDDTDRGGISAAGSWTLNAPSSGITLTASGAASAATEVQRWTDGTRTAHLYISNSGSGTDVQFGSSGGLFLYSNTGTNYLVLGTGLQIGAATGGDKGAGTLNTAGAIYQNNVPLYETGSFTGTLTGYASNPTGTVYYQRTGSIVHMWITASISGTSNANTFTMTGIPAGLRPASGWRSTGHFRVRIQSLGAETFAIGEVDTSGVMTFYEVSNDGTSAPNANTWNTSDTKELSAGWYVSYPL